MNVTQEPNNRGYVRPYLRKRKLDDYDNTLEICWIRLYRAPEADDKNRMYSEYIKKGAGLRYATGAFKGVAKDWEIAMIEAAEDVFEHIRKHKSSLAKLRRSATWIDKDMQVIRQCENKISGIMGGHDHAG